VSGRPVDLPPAGNGGDGDRYEHADPFTKTVQVTLGRLRRKLGEPDVIETVRRVGYRIAP
jgi:DNA-binding response OmpR family regulator